MSELNIPESWAEATFEKVFKVNPRNKIEDDNLDVAFVPMNSVNQNTASIESEETRKWGDVKKGYTHFRNGDVIFAKITPCMENKKSSLAENLCNGYGAGSTEFHVLRPPKEILGKFALHFVRSDFFLDDASNNMSGTAGQKRVPTTWLNQYLFPVPPIKEQERIVQKIESCLKKIDATEANLSKVEILLERYSESLLRKAFRGELFPQVPGDESVNTIIKKIEQARISNQTGKNNDVLNSSISDEEKPFELPNHWAWVRLGTIFNFIDYRGKNPPRSKDGVRILTAKNIRNGFIQDEPVEFISQETYKKWMVRGFPKKGDILFITEGHTMGYIAQVDFDYKFALAQRTITLQPFMTGYADLIYYFLRSSIFQNELKKNATGAAAQGVKAGTLKNMIVPLIPTKEAELLLGLLRRSENKTKLIRSNTRSCWRLLDFSEDSLLNKAFEGRLVDQISTEGTGHELLIKILNEKDNSQKTQTELRTKNTKNKAPFKTEEAVRGKKNGKK
jgi:type I restriction enzyme S subunit